MRVVSLWWRPSVSGITDGLICQTPVRSQPIVKRLRLTAQVSIGLMCQWSRWRSGVIGVTMRDLTDVLISLIFCDEVLFLNEASLNQSAIAMADYYRWLVQSCCWNKEIIGMCVLSFSQLNRGPSTADRTHGLHQSVIWKTRAHQLVGLGERLCCCGSYYAVPTHRKQCLFRFLPIGEYLQHWALWEQSASNRQQVSEGKIYAGADAGRLHDFWPLFVLSDLQQTRKCPNQCVYETVGPISSIKLQRLVITGSSVTEKRYGIFDVFFMITPDRK